MSFEAKTGNPMFRAMTADAWAYPESRATTMSVQGTAIKTLILFAILLTTAALAWVSLGRGELGMPVLFGGLIVGAITAVVTAFKPMWAHVTGPIYAAAEGLVLGAVSALFERAYQGIVVNAASLTMMTLFVMLMIYSNRWIRVTDKLRIGIVAATGAIALVYLASMLMSMFLGHGIPLINSPSPLGIAFSVFVVGLAAFNLLLDFDFIERSAASGLPKQMEWYGAFALLVTLVWVYLEILRLLAKLQDRR